MDQAAPPPLPGRRPSMVGKYMHERPLARKVLVRQKTQENVDKIYEVSVKCLDDFQKPGMDFAVDNVEDAVNNVRELTNVTAFLKRRRYTMFAFGVGALGLTIFVQCAISYATGGVSKSRDQYLKLYEEAVFKQIATTLLVVAFFAVGNQLHYVQSILDTFFFSEISQQLRFNHIQEVMDSLLIRTLVFAALFLAYAAYLAFCAFYINRWLRRIDSLSVHDVASGAKGSREAAKFLALRQEFEDTAQQSSVPGLDPPGLYFQNYCRACTFHIASRLLNIPPKTLLTAFSIGLIFIFTPVAHFAHGREVALMLGLSAGCAVFNGLLFIRIWFLKRQLLPRDTRKYLALRLSMENATDSVAEPSPKALDSTNIPYLTKQYHRTTCLPVWLAMFIYGTRSPNPHDQIFQFWRNGPSVLIQMCQMAIFFQLVATTLLTMACSTHHKVWFDQYWPLGILAGSGIALLQWPLLCWQLWDLVVVTCTSGRIEDKVLQAVWETQRARTVQRLRTLVDTLRCEANLFRVERGGRQLRDLMADRAQLEDGANIRSDDISFRSLDAPNLGIIPVTHFMRHLLSEGIPVRSEADAQRWATAFDAKGRGFLDREDFAVMNWNIRALLTNPLDIEDVQVLFAEKLRLPMDGQLDVLQLQGIFKKWGLNWTRVHLYHLFHYMTGQRNTRSLSVEHFINSLRAVEFKTIGTIRQAAGELVHEPDSFDYLSEGDWDEK